MIRAVLDTNVLVSGLLSPSGNEPLILLASYQGIVHPCFSAEILDEYAAVLARPKFSFPSDEIAALLAMLRDRGELVRPSASPAASPDATDTKFLDCAHAAKADFIITGNKRHYPDAPYGITHVASAGELLDRITLEM